MMRKRVGMAMIFGLLALGPAAQATGSAAGSAVPRAGDWEGTGSHGLPLSFDLVDRGGRLVLRSLAVGYPASCPALARDAEAVPLISPVYTGPGGASGVSTAAPVGLAGQVPGSKRRVSLGGSFSTPGAGSFSIRIHRPVGCGWPDQTLVWSAHRAARRRVANGTWAGALTAAGLINGNVRLVVGEQGRVVDSFTSFFTCLTDTQQGNTTFRAVPAYEFVRPDGSFVSPLNGGKVGGHVTIWSGSFSPAGRLTGSLTIFDDCTNRLIKARFSARRTGA